MSAKEVRQYYKLILDNHDIIMLALQEGYKGRDKRGYPLLTQAEVVVVDEGLKVFFADELAELVRYIYSIALPLLNTYNTKDSSQAATTSRVSLQPSATQRLE